MSDIARTALGPKRQPTRNGDPVSNGIPSTATSAFQLPRVRQAHEGRDPHEARGPERVLGQERRHGLLGVSSAFGQHPLEELGGPGVRRGRKMAPGAPTSMSCPWSMTITRSATSRANCISWVTTIMVMPSCASCRITFRTSPTSSGSRAEVTSSKSMASGCIASARAMATRCCCPPRAGAGRPRPCPRARCGAGARWRGLGPRPGPRRTWIGPAVTLSSTVMWGNEVEALEDHPHLEADGPDRPVVGSSRVAVQSGLREVDPLDGDGPAVDRLEGVQRPEQRGLSRAARADHHHHLAGIDVEGHAAQDLERPEALPHVADDDQRGRGPRAGVDRRRGAHAPIRILRSSHATPRLAG